MRYNTCSSYKKSPLYWMFQHQDRVTKSVIMTVWTSCFMNTNISQEPQDQQKYNTNTVFCSKNIYDLALEQAVPCAHVTQRARVRSPVGISGRGFFGVFPRILFGRHNHPFIFTLLQWMGTWMLCIVFHVCVVSEVAPALSWSFVWGGSPCPCVAKKVLTYVIQS